MPLTERPFKEFRDSGLLWFVNRTLHVFGWALVYAEEDDGTGTISRWYPARVTYRGFAQETEDEGYARVAKYLENNATELYEEAKYGEYVDYSGDLGTRPSLIDKVHELLNREDPDRPWEQQVESLEELQTFIEDRLNTTIAGKPWVGKDGD